MSVVWVVFLPVTFATKRFSCLAGYPRKRSLAIPRCAVYVNCTQPTSTYRAFILKNGRLGEALLDDHRIQLAHMVVSKTSVVNLPPGGNH